MIDQTPIERAQEAIANLDWSTSEYGYAPEEHEVALAAFDSIDTNELVSVILRTELPGGLKVGHADKIALAVKNWLTGKDIQQ